MTIRATMAGLSGMSAPYARRYRPDQHVQRADGQDHSSAVLTEETRRQLRLFANAIGQGASEAAIRQNILNFSDKLIPSPSRYDGVLRGSASRPVNSTGSSATSGSWSTTASPPATCSRTGPATPLRRVHVEVVDDYRAARSLLHGQVLAVVAHPDTIDQIISNSVNNIIVTAQDLITGSAPSSRTWASPPPAR